MPQISRSPPPPTKTACRSAEASAVTTEHLTLLHPIPESEDVEMQSLSDSFGRAEAEEFVRAFKTSLFIDDVSTSVLTS